MNVSEKKWQETFLVLFTEEFQKLPEKFRKKINVKIDINDESEKVYHLFDYNEGNILIQNEKISGLIDLERISITPLLFSLSVILDTMFDDFKSPICMQFLDAYGKEIDMQSQTVQKYLLFNRMKYYNIEYSKRWEKKMLEIISSF